MSEDNKWSQPDSPPPPLFTGQKEKDFVKQVNDEVIERVIGQTIVYYPISLEHTNFHSLYGEAIDKSFLHPIRVYAMVKYGHRPHLQHLWALIGLKRYQLPFIREG